MADTNNNKKPETTDSIIEPSGFHPPYWTETPQNQNPGNLEEDLKSEKQPLQETSVTSISGEEVNPVEVEKEIYPAEEKVYSPEEKPYPEQSPKGSQINLEQPKQTTTLIPIPPTLTELQTDTVTTIANKEEEGFIEENLAQHEQ